MCETQFPIYRFAKVSGLAHTRKQARNLRIDCPLATLAAN